MNVWCPKVWSKWILLMSVVLMGRSAWGHDPIFGLGPHVLYKGGVEVATEIYLEEKGNERETELALELAYGFTGDWAAGVEFPYVWKEEGVNRSTATGDMVLFTKYRFWRHDTLGAQDSAAVSLKVKTDTGDVDSKPAAGTGTIDTVLGLTYGHEGRKWYRWASLRYRYTGGNDAGLKRGDKILLDVVGGVRPKLTSYLEPDTVWLLELNGEYGESAKFEGVELTNTGGTEWFLSPGVFWTKRNFAVKAGVQIPIASEFKGNQEKTDYRAKLVLEWHL